MKEYALYKGDALLDFGTLSELSAKRGVKIETMKYYRTPAYQRKLERRNSKKAIILVDLGDEND